MSEVRKSLKNKLKSKLPLILLGAGLLVSLAAAAIPMPGPDESYLQTYYYDAEMQNYAGERLYGYCGESYRSGNTSTRHFRFEKITCGDGLPH